MGKNHLRNICEKVISKRFPDVKITEYQALDLHKYNEKSQKWEKNGNNSIFIIVETKNDLKNLSLIEKQLELITGCEISVST